MDAPAAVRRDVRVDRIGFVAELVRHWIEGDGGVKARLKSTMEAGESVEGDFFVGRLDASTETTIDPLSIIRLYDQGRLKRAQLAGMIRVLAAQAREVLDEKTYGRLAQAAPGTPRLNVARKPGVRIELVRAVEGITEALVPRAARAA